MVITVATNCARKVLVEHELVNHRPSGNTPRDDFDCGAPHAPLSERDSLTVPTRVIAAEQERSDL